jgi:hypothetical protein
MPIELLGAIEFPRPATPTLAGAGVPVVLLVIALGYEAAGTAHPRKAFGVRTAASFLASETRTPNLKLATAGGRNRTDTFGQGDRRKTTLTNPLGVKPAGEQSALPGSSEQIH